MPAGGRRPGAGRPRRSKTVLQLAAKIEKTATAATYEPGDPTVVLGLVSEGKTVMPDGTIITPMMIGAAKELLPFFKARLATTSNREERRGPPETITTDDLLYERTELQRQLAAVEKELDRARDPGEQRDIAAQGSTDEFPEFLRDGAGAAEP